jgi:hypothetical protein
MMRVDCEFEAEVLAAALQSRWPDRVDADLRAHVAKCPICSDVATVTVEIDKARGEMCDQMRECAVLPEAGRVWWLARMRARREAARTAGRPITVAQVLAFACAMGLLGACFGATSTWFQSALRVCSGAIGGMSAFLPSAAELLAAHAALAAGMAALVFLLPAAVYLAMRRD